MLTKIFLSSSVILALSICCHCARKHNFSMFKNLVPYSVSRDKYMGVGVEYTFKHLKGGEPCSYVAFVRDKIWWDAKSHCNENAGLNCVGVKCTCMAKDLKWDPTVQSVLSFEWDKPPHFELMTGQCAAPKGKGCSERTDNPDYHAGTQCMDGLTCVFPPTTTKIPKKLDVPPSGDEEGGEDPWKYGTCK